MDNGRGMVICGSFYFGIVEGLRKRGKCWRRENDWCVFVCEDSEESKDK
jgi:hypothetical protein